MNKIKFWYHRGWFVLYRDYWSKKSYMGYHLPLLGENFTELTIQYEKLKWMKFSDFTEKFKIKMILMKSTRCQHILLRFLGACAKI